MNNSEYNIRRLKEAAIKLLNCENLIGLMHEAVHEMYSIYLDYTTISITDQNDDYIMLPSGKAISPASAAHCLLEMVRTTKFIRGINKAINDKLQSVSQVRILYAGCGPYAALVTPLLTLFSSNEVIVDLLDINEKSLMSVKGILSGLALESFADQYFLEDAATFKINREYDMVISETLNSALRNEPFVAIYQNMLTQIGNECLFIPQQVVVDLKQNTRGKWNALTGCVENQVRINHAEIMNVNAISAQFGLPSMKLKIFNPYMDEKTELKLYTTVKIYDDQVLVEGESAFNMPLKLIDLEAGKEIELKFTYSQEYPVGIKITHKNCFSKNNYFKLLN
jgi:hypothetical protein